MSTEAAPISLEDLDRLLEAEDPGFAASLDSLRAVASDGSVTIDSSVVDDPEFEGSGERPRARLSLRPRELAFSLVAGARGGLEYLAYVGAAFKRARRAEQCAVVGLLALAALSSWVLARNLRGVWLPRLSPGPLTKFAPYADSIGTYSGADDLVGFDIAFPAERFEFLFDKMKVNLRATTDHPGPMGAFEFVAVVDAKSTAIEMNRRVTEFGDVLQRVLEGASFTELEGETGKIQLKNRLKRELNRRLAAGSVRDIDFKTFILKP